jgi:hypothetical protein
MMPKQDEIEIPVLAALEKLGGKGGPREIYVAVTKSFPQLKEGW